MDLKQKIELKKLKDHNVSRLEIHYSGGGDDGCIDMVAAFNIDDQRIENLDDDDFSALDDYFYDMLCENIDWDWVNNDGGYGVMHLKIDEEKIFIDHVQRVTEDYDYPVNEHEIFKVLNGTS